MLYISFLIIFINFVISVERIWLLRHCDKPINNNNPCCSALGYQRADNWFFYFISYLNKNDNIAIYSSNYNEKKICLKQNKYNPDRNCQKSQRMFLTAYYIHNQLTNNKYNVKNNINLDYCIGDKSQLIDNIINNIINNKNINDVIVVWEHKEIIEIIRYFNIHISKWHNRFKDVYDLIFLIDIVKKKLYIDCYNFITNGTSCSKDLKIWLQDFDSISQYYEKILYSSFHDINYTNKLSKVFIYLFIVFSLYIVIFGIYIYILQIYKRRGYIQIN
jgi:hypothetical protein